MFRISRRLGMGKMRNSKYEVESLQQPCGRETARKGWFEDGTIGSERAKYELGNRIIHKQIREKANWRSMISIPKLQNSKFSLLPSPFSLNRSPFSLLQRRCQQSGDTWIAHVVGGCEVFACGYEGFCRLTTNSTYQSHHALVSHLHGIL